MPHETLAPFRKSLRLLLILCELLVCLVLVLSQAMADGLVEGRLGVINHKDGYTYVHQEAAKDSKVITTVRKGEHFRVFPNDGHWWRVRVASGLEGFMHESRIRLLEEPDPAPAPGGAK